MVVVVVLLDVDNDGDDDAWERRLLTNVIGFFSYLEFIPDQKNMGGSIGRFSLVNNSLSIGCLL